MTEDHPSESLESMVPQTPVVREGGPAPSDATAEPSAAFTPGPWYADRTWRDAEGVFARADDEAVAYCNEPFGGPTLPNAAANARLIAAAPDLYDALRLVLSIVAPVGGGSAFISSGTERVARAALAKADQIIARGHNASLAESAAAGPSACAATAPHSQSDVERIHEVMEDGGGCWRSCSGCYETNEGYDVGPRSPVFKSHMGGGCGECGGLGVIWDNTDYDAMAREILAEERTPTPVFRWRGRLMAGRLWRLRWWLRWVLADNDAPLRERRRRFHNLTGLHPCYVQNRFVADDEVIALQARKIRGLEMQLNQQRIGYQRKIAKLLAQPTREAGGRTGVGDEGPGTDQKTTPKQHLGGEEG